MAIKKLEEVLYEGKIIVFLLVISISFLQIIRIVIVIVIVIMLIIQPPPQYIYFLTSLASDLRKVMQLPFNKGKKNNNSNQKEKNVDLSISRAPVPHCRA